MLDLNPLQCEADLEIECIHKRYGTHTFCFWDTHRIHTLEPWDTHVIHANHEKKERNLGHPPQDTCYGNMHPVPK